MAASFQAWEIRLVPWRRGGGGQDENIHGSFKTSVSGTTCCRSSREFVSCEGLVSIHSLPSQSRGVEWEKQSRQPSLPFGIDLAANMLLAQFNVG